MKRLRVEFRPSATFDLLTIFEYIFDVSGSAEMARRFTHRIRERCERVGDVPFGGRSRDVLFPGLRTFPFEHSAVVAYTIEGECVGITNIFYGGRDYEALYRAEPTPDKLE